MRMREPPLPTPLPSLHPLGQSPPRCHGWFPRPNEPRTGRRHTAVQSRACCRCKENGLDTRSAAGVCREGIRNHEPHDNEFPFRVFLCDSVATLTKARILKPRKDTEGHGRTRKDTEERGRDTRPPKQERPTHTGHSRSMSGHAQTAGATSVGTVSPLPRPAPPKPKGLSRL